MHASIKLQTIIQPYSTDRIAVPGDPIPTVPAQQLQALYGTGTSRTVQMYHDESQVHGQGVKAVDLSGKSVVNIPRVLTRKHLSLSSRSKSVQNARQNRDYRDGNVENVPSRTPAYCILPIPPWKHYPQVLGVICRMPRVFLLLQYYLYTCTVYCICTEGTVMYCSNPS